MATVNGTTDDMGTDSRTMTAVVLIEALALLLAAGALYEGANLFAIAMLLISIRAGLAG